MDVTCPNCGHTGDEEEFEISLADECFCPKCEAEFLVEQEEDGDADE